MPYLDPNPQNGQKKLLLVLCAMLGIGAVIAVVATIVSPS
ncbi:SGM_5486 family transporter-associated protein [Streptomyces tritici]